MEKEGIKMKTYTDLEQSKKLAEILPLESADMHYNNVSVRGVNYVDDYMAELMDYNTATKVLSKYSINPLFGVVPCWSLAALLDILPDRTCIFKKTYKEPDIIHISPTFRYHCRWTIIWFLFKVIVFVMLAVF